MYWPTFVASLVDFVVVFVGDDVVAVVDKFVVVDVDDEEEVGGGSSLTIRSR